MKIAFVLYDGFSTFDFASLYEPLTMLKSLEILPDLTWQLCAKKKTVRDGQSLPFTPTEVSKSLDSFDLVVIPGCTDPQKVLQKEDFLRWLGSAQKTPWLASVGSGTLLLAAAGLLQDKRAAAGEHADVLKEYGALPEAKDLLEDDAIFTAADSSHALKLAYSLCAQLAGLGAAEQVRQQLGGDASGGMPTELTSDEPVSSGEGLRYARVIRKTRETDIELEIDLDGTGEYEIETGLPFLDHMLAQVAAHGLFDLKVKAVGDLHIDPHHTLEDVSLAMGEAFRQALGERGGIVRTASRSCPMDESLATVTVDFSGRPYAVVQADWQASHVGGLPATLFKHFMESFASQARCNLHAKIHYGEDDHHKAEALFKAFGRAVDAAAQIDERRGGQVPSTKGVLF